MPQVLSCKGMTTLLFSEKPVLRPRSSSVTAHSCGGVQMCIRDSYDGCCRDLPKDEVEKRLAAGEPYVIRQKIPREGVTGFDDVVFGHIEVNLSLIHIW